MKAPESKESNLSSGTLAKRSSSSDCTHSVVKERRKRVWKACERCRMKKIKCDGVSPCERCKDDGFVCTAGSRRKVEQRPSPRGYAEVLENSQHALIATVQKLYTMLRNKDSWELEEPEMNDRGQPVIHDIASKLGCIRTHPGLPYSFPESESDFAQLQIHMKLAEWEIWAEVMGSRMETTSKGSPILGRLQTASSAESEYSRHHQFFSSLPQSQQQQRQKSILGNNLQPIETKLNEPTSKDITGITANVNMQSYDSRTTFDIGSSMPSPVYTGFPTNSSLLSNVVQFSTWSCNDDFLSQPHAPNLVAQHNMRCLCATDDGW